MDATLYQASVANMPEPPQPLAASGPSRGATPAATLGLDPSKLEAARIPTPLHPDGEKLFRVLSSPSNGRRFLSSSHHPMDMMTIHKTRSMVLLAVGVIVLEWSLRSML